MEGGYPGGRRSAGPVAARLERASTRPSLAAWRNEFRSMCQFYAVWPHLIRRSGDQVDDGLADLRTVSGPRQPMPDQSRTVAFHLPQYHRIPENDAWWGDGFTDWVNVSRGEPAFAGHDQPPSPQLWAATTSPTRICVASPNWPARPVSTRSASTSTGSTVSDCSRSPVDLYADDDGLLPYCLCWANEAWSRRWDGKHQDVLMPQTYPPVSPTRSSPTCCPTDPPALPRAGRPARAGGAPGGRDPRGGVGRRAVANSPSPRNCPGSI